MGGSRYTKYARCFNEPRGSYGLEGYQRDYNYPYYERGGDILIYLDPIEWDRPTPQKVEWNVRSKSIFDKHFNHSGPVGTFDDPLDINYKIAKFCDHLEDGELMRLNEYSGLVWVRYAQYNSSWDWLIPVLAKIRDHHRSIHQVTGDRYNIDTMFNFAKTYILQEAPDSD